MFQVPSSNKRLISIQIIYGQPVTRSRIWESIKSGDKKLTAEKVNLLADHRGNAVSNFFNSIFIEKQVVLLFSDINVQWPKVRFSQVFEKTNCNAFSAFETVIYNG